jgi:hypothetical protein
VQCAESSSIAGTVLAGVTAFASAVELHGTVTTCLTGRACAVDGVVVSAVRMAADIAYAFPVAFL